MSEEPRYRGRSLRDLDLVDISWSGWSVDHILSRTTRYPNDKDELDIEPEWATEAALDPNGRLNLTAENDLRVTGWSEHAPPASWSQRPGRVLRVILKQGDIDSGYWIGFTAAPANQKTAEWYWNARRSYGAA